MMSPLCAKGLQGKKDVYVKIAALHPIAFPSPNSQCIRLVLKQYGSQTPSPFFFSSSKLSK